MDIYFIQLTIIEWLILVFMGIFLMQSDGISKEERRCFLCADFLIAGISVLEIITLIAERLPAQFRAVTILSNYLGFGLTPAVPLMLAYCISERRDFRKAMLAEGGYLLFLTVTLPFGGVFRVDADNVYARGSLFSVYLLFCVYALFYLIRATLQLMHRYQNQGKTLIAIMIAVLLFGAVTQVIYPEIHLTWLCVTLLLLLYYIYCSNIWQQSDGLTGLLTQKSYLIRTGKLQRRVKLIVFDVDDFKSVNDRYGHLVGDECLRIIAACMIRAYAGSGLCYRIGGDEFCVLLEALQREESCSRKFTRFLDDAREDYEILPTVSFGAAMFKPGDSAEKVKNKADKNMYIYKRQRKAQKAQKA